MPRLTILTDFGTRDGFVGAMKGVIAAIAPAVPIDDVGHDLERGDVSGAMWTFARYWRRYPEGTVHLVVVDPGVGTERRALAATLQGRHVVAPDNGVVTLALEATRRPAIVEIRNPSYVQPGGSATFHGRDVFAPAAAHLAAGVPLDELGPRVENPVTLPVPEPVASGEEAEGEVVYVDRFGNAFTNIPGGWVGEGARVRVRGRVLPLRRTYGEAAPGEPLAVVNSDGLVEVAVRDGSAAESLGAAVGDPVRVLGVRAG